jgi:hypothetical protein
MRDRTPPLEQRIEQLASLDTSPYKGQPGCAPNTTTTTQASARKMDCKIDGTPGTVGLANNDSLTCSNCARVSRISHNCRICDLMKKLLEQALVGNDAPKAKPGHPHKDMKRGGTLTGRKESGRIAEE